MNAPAPPTLTAVVPRGQALLVTWNKVAGADGYQLFFGTSPNDYTAGPVDVGNASEFTIRNLKNGTAYYIAAKSFTNEKQQACSIWMRCGTPGARRKTTRPSPRATSTPSSRARCA